MNKYALLTDPARKGAEIAEGYGIRLEMQKCPFAAGQIVIGSLVPWRGEWYWSGGQRMWHKADAVVLAALKKEYVEKLSVIAYRYSRLFPGGGEQRKSFG
jgi:hypothetical protein